MHKTEIVRQLIGFVWNESIVAAWLRRKKSSNTWIAQTIANDIENPIESSPVIVKILQLSGAAINHTTWCLCFDFIAQNCNFRTVHALRTKIFRHCLGEIFVDKNVFFTRHVHVVLSTSLDNFLCSLQWMHLLVHLFPRHKGDKRVTFADKWFQEFVLSSRNKNK